MENMPDSKTNRIVLRDIIAVCLDFAKETEPTFNEDKVLMGGHLLFQMTILRCISILNLSESTFLIGERGTKLNTIDISSIKTIQRAIQENYCIFHNIYCASKNTDEIKLKYDLWTLSAMKNRQNTNPKGDDEIKKKSEEAELIKTYESEIRNSKLYKALDTKSSKILDDEIKRKNYLIKVDGNSIRPVNWEQLMEVAKVKENLRVSILSTTLDSHPSKLSVVHFSSRYGNLGQLENELTTCLALTYIFLSFFIFDVFTYFKIKNKIPDDALNVIERINKEGRTI